MKERDWLMICVVGVGLLVGLVMLVDAIGFYVSKNYFSFWTAVRTQQWWLMRWTALFTIRGVPSPSLAVTYTLFGFSAVWVALSLLCLRWLRPLRWVMIGLALVSLWYTPMAWLMAGVIALAALTKIEKGAFASA